MVPVTKRKHYLLLSSFLSALFPPLLSSHLLLSTLLKTQFFFFLQIESFHLRFLNVDASGTKISSWRLLEAHHLLHAHGGIHIWIQLSDVIEACHVAVGCTFDVRMGRFGNRARKLFIAPWNANDSRGEGATSLCRSLPISHGHGAVGERSIEGKRTDDESPIRGADNHHWQVVWWLQWLSCLC